jgi:diguanylate cyclase (GGDEF)-like protein
VRLTDENLAIIYIHDLREIKKTLEMAERMESIAYTDELTKLYTRRYFMENAERTLSECKESGKPYHLIMADLDHSKNVNDTYGHQIGDEVLKIAAQRMQGTTRKGTVLARYGGEEFIVELTGLSYDDALNTAKRIQRNIEESKFMIKGLSIAVTVSLGVATGGSPTDTLDDLIYMADAALYGAKRTGRNKVMEYSEVKDVNWLSL